MKNKGISLIVLIITIVVIIILATAIIVNIAQTNLIENANEAVVKQDFKTMQDELTLYKADRYVQEKGNFKAEDLDVTDKAVIAQIIPTIVGSKYEEYVVIEDGIIAISETMPDPQKTWAMEALGLIKTSTNRPTQDTIAPTVPTTLELTVDGNIITAKASGSTDIGGGISKYMYSLDNTTWQESNIFNNLEEFKEYTVYAKAIDKSGNESEVLSNKVTTEELMLVVFDNTKGSTNATINGEEFAYDNPVVPVGFKAVTTAEAAWSDEDNNGKIDGWNNGLVIQDENKNEFVWVPVDGTNVKYAKWCTTYISYSTCTDDKTAIPVTDETDQITKYKGFYIARYETTVPDNQTEITGETSASNTTGIPTCKKGSKIWTHHSYLTVRENAKTLKNDDFAKSGLVTGRQYDTMLTWLTKTGVNVADARSWGNCNDSITPANIEGVGIKQVAGYSEKWKVNNIYNLGGNTFEWTAEFYSGGGAITRGAACSHSGGTFNPTRRTNSVTDLNITHELVGSRLALFVQ